MNYADRWHERLRPKRVLAKLAHEGRVLVAPVSARRAPLRTSTFTAWGQSHQYFVHPYNLTWRNERAVEIPLALDFLVRHGSGRGMEFGNVLSHYGVAIPRAVVDRYEQSKDVTNTDILEFESQPLDFIVAISTLEHVGWDEKPRDPEKALRAFDRLRALLAPQGAMFLSMPLGYNDVIDHAVRDGLPMTRQCVLVKNGGRWTQAIDLEIRPYIQRGDVGAQSVWIGEIESASRA